MTNTIVHVAAGIVVAGIAGADHQRVFLTRRAEHAHQGGKWEFPGGKLEPGESVEQALARELEEEIGIKVIQSSAFESLIYHYPEKTVQLDFYLVSEFSGQPQGCEGQLGQWFDFAQLAELDFPTANQVVVEKLLAC